MGSECGSVKMWRCGNGTAGSRKVRKSERPEENTSRVVGKNGSREEWK